MNYLLDRKAKRAKILKIASGLILLGVVFYFRTGVFAGLSRGAAAVFRPMQAAMNRTAAGTSALRSYFMTKGALYRENEMLRREILSRNAAVANHETLLRENEDLKETLGRKPEGRNLLLAAILAKPNRSPYDTLSVDAGAEDGVSEGDLVFALGNVPIGRVGLVTPDTARVVMFSSASEKTHVIIPASVDAGTQSDVFWEVVGRGGGNFEMILPRDFILNAGDEAVMPGIRPYAVAITEKILSDPRDSFKKALLRSPVNIQDLKFVEIDLGR